MVTTARVQEILGWYGSDNPGVKAGLHRLMMTGRLAGTGRMVILPVDQGFEHGPARSFAPNDAGYDPRYHFQLAIDSGCNAYAAPLGFIEAGADEFAGQLPLILKVNNNNSLYSAANPISALTSGIDDALRLGCVGIGFTIYPGTAHFKQSLEELRELTREAKAKGLVVVTWAYPRGEQIAKADETAVDIVAYAAQIAAQMGSHIIKVKPPHDAVGLGAAKGAYDKAGIPTSTLTERIAHVVEAAFAGRRIVIFSGGAAKGTDAVLEDVRGIAAGGGFGSIMGRNAFQRPKAEAIELLQTVMDIFAEAAKS